MKKFLVKCTFEGEACHHVVMAENAYAAGEESWRIHEESWMEREGDPGELPFQIDDIEEVTTPVFHVKAELNNDSRAFVLAAASPAEAIHRAYVSLGAKVVAVQELMVEGGEWVPLDPQTLAKFNDPDADEAQSGAGEVVGHQGPQTADEGQSQTDVPQDDANVSRTAPARDVPSAGVAGTDGRWE